MQVYRLKSKVAKGMLILLKLWLLETYGTAMYSRRQYKVSVPLKKKRYPTAYQRLKKVTVFTAFIRSQFLHAIFHLTPPKIHQ